VLFRLKKVDHFGGYLKFRQLILESSFPISAGL